MKHIWLGALWLALWGVLPAVSGAQQASPAPLERLMENRQALLLTEVQVTRLEAIRASLRQRNEPMIASIVELRREFQREQRTLRGRGRQQGQAQQTPPFQNRQVQPTARMEEIRVSTQGLLEQIQANNRAAMQEVNQLLTRPQRARLRELVQTRRPAPGRGASGSAGAGGLRAPAGLGG